MATQESTTTSPPQRRLRIRWAVLSMDFLVLGLNYADRAALGIAGTFIIKEFDLTKAQFGLVASIFFFGYVPFNFIGGYLSDKLGPRKVMGAAIAWWSAFTALTAAGTGFVSLLVIRFLFGIGEGPQASVTAKTMSNWYPRRELGRALGISQSSTPLGGAIAAPLVVAILEATNNNWRVAFIILGAIGLLFTVGWVVVVRDTPAQHPWVSAAEVREIEEGQAETPSSAPAHDHSIHDGTAGDAAPGLLYYARQPLVLATAFAFFGYAWVLYTFLTWFPVYLLQARGVSLSSLSFAGAIPWIAGFIGFGAGGIVTDWIANKTGNYAETRKWIIVVCLLLTAGFQAATIVATSAAAAVALTSAVVFTLYLTGAQYFAIIADLVPRIRFGGVVGFVHSIANLAGILAPFIVGYIVDTTHSWGLTFGLAAVICAAGAIGLILFGSTKRYRELELPETPPPSNSPRDTAAFPQQSTGQ